MFEALHYNGELTPYGSASNVSSIVLDNLTVSNEEPNVVYVALRGNRIKDYNNDVRSIVSSGDLDQSFAHLTAVTKDGDIYEFLTDFYRDPGGWDFVTNAFDLIRVKMVKKSN